MVDQVIRTFLAHSALVLNKNIQLCKYSVAIEIYFDKYKHFWQLLNFRSHGLSVIDCNFSFQVTNFWMNISELKASDEWCKNTSEE